MRYMWICSRHMAPSYVRRLLEDEGATVVTRILNTKGRACWVFFTNYLHWQFARTNSLNDDQADHWSITTCNKQYVVNESTGKYLGALGEVDLDEARAWVLEDNANWFLRDPDPDTLWMPLQRNPNKLIPTGDAGYCRHCGNTSAQTPGNRYQPQYRPWPLHVDA